MVDVVVIERDPLTPGQQIAALDLSQAGHARSHLKSPCFARAITTGDFHERRARPNETHIRAKHIPKLRQLIEAPTPQEASHARDARISCRRFERMRLLTSILNHGSKFPLVESFSAVTCAAQLEKNGPARIEPYRRSDQQEYCRENRERQQRDDHVENTLHRELSATGQIIRSGARNFAAASKFPDPIRPKI